MAIHIGIGNNGKLQGRIPQVDELTYEERKRKMEEQRKKDNQRTLNDYKLNPTKGNTHAIPQTPSEPTQPTLEKKGEFADVISIFRAPRK